ncbi:MAG: hypothetical protein BGO78_05080 [Chloroflexi bacterium 44-23]|nr:MAG: hypothetical protein BGO78_05080 [Chloroflexi bacterium 44-23]
MIEKAIWKNQGEVRTYETDLNGYWKPAAFYRAMEEATVHHSAHLNVDFFSLQQYGLAWVLARSKTKFFHFPTSGTQLIIKTWPKGWGQKIFGMRDYSITTLDGTVCALSTSAWLLIDTSSRHFVKPERLRVILPDNHGQFALDELLDKLGQPADMQPVAVFQARYSSLDLMGHVNNTQYIDWIFDCFPVEEIRDLKLDWLQINFNNEIQPDEMLTIEMAPLSGPPGCYAFRGNNQNNDTIAFDAQLGFRTGS